MGIARSGIGWLIARLGALALTWLASLYFTRALTDPQTSLGTYYAFETVVTLAVLFANGGLNGAIIKRVSEGEAQNAYATAGLILSGGLVILVSIAIVVATPWLTAFFGYGGLSVVLLIGTVVAYQVRDTLGALLTSDFSLGRTGFISFINALGQVSVQVGLIVAGFGTLALLTGYVVGAALAACVSIALVVPRFELRSPNRSHFERMISFAKFSFLHSFTQKFYDNIDIIIITWLLGKAATGVYGIGFRFSLLITVFYSAINRTSEPEISRVDACGDYDRIREVLSDSVVLGLLFGLPAFAGFTVLARPIIITFYTNSFEAAAIVATVAVATRIPEGIRSTLGTILSGMDYPDIAFRGGVLLIGTNAVLDLVLVPTVGIVGAVVASLVGMIVQLVYYSYHVRGLLDLSVGDLPTTDVAIELFGSLVMAAIVFAVRQRIGYPTVYELIGLIALGIVSYFIVVLSLGPDIRNRVLSIASDVIPV